MKVLFAAHIAARGHGRQVLLAETACELVDALSPTDLGEHRVRLLS